ncbi:MAG: SEC59/DGK1/VTE5 family protein [Methanomassiliicoccales archaeon]|nr:SEC59/DGK1/VTE5 family protein [Methanomassiliicoccales archaeon]
MVSSGDLAGLASVYGYVILILLISAFVKRRRIGGIHRKVIHILIGNIVLFWWMFDSPYIMAFLAAAPFIPLLLLVSPISPVRKLRTSFLGETTGESHGLGLVYYAISWTILAFFLFDDRMVASIAIVAMSYGDGFGGLIGKRYGKRRILREKTLEGTTAVFTATLVATMAVIVFYQFLAASGTFGTFMLDPISALGVAVLTGVFVALVELVTPGEYDNLTIPLLTAGLLILVGV